jgi:hypothetical protein
MTRKWDSVDTLPDAILNHYIFGGGMLALQFANRTLTYTEIARRVKQWHDCGDATPGELKLARLLQAEVDSFNASMEF